MVFRMGPRSVGKRAGSRRIAQASPGLLVAGCHANEGKARLLSDCAQRLRSVTAAALRFEQDALDDIGLDVVGFQVFDGSNGIAAFLHRDAMVDNVSPVNVYTLILRGCKCGATVLVSLSIHVHS